MPLRRLLLLSLMLLPAAPATAPAATVSMREDKPNKYDSGSAHLTFTARPGERNAVTLARDGASLVVQDLGAPLTPGAACAALDANTVRCSSTYGIVSADVDLGDLDDALRSAFDPAVYLSLRVLGADGADTLTGPGTLTGGAGNDVLTGSAQQDTLNGGAGDDVLRGLGGDDQLSGDGVGSTAGDPAAGNDLLDGGDGRDAVSYAGRTVPVNVDLAAAEPDGQAGEHDRLIGIEGVEGGHGADVITGDTGPNLLSGGDGDDAIRGLGGDDRLSDGAGKDTLLGGDGGDMMDAGGAGDRAFGEAGDDKLTGGTGAALDGGDGNDAFGVALAGTYTTVVCGPGHDSLAGVPLAGQRVGTDCEDIHIIPFDPFWIATVPIRRPGNVFSLPAGCNKLPAITPDCRGKVTLRLRRPGRKPLVLGARSFVLGAQSFGFVRIQVRRSARRALAQARRPLLEVELNMLPRGLKLPNVLVKSVPHWTVRLG